MINFIVQCWSFLMVAHIGSSTIWRIEVGTGTLRNAASVFQTSFMLNGALNKTAVLDLASKLEAGTIFGRNFTTVNADEFGDPKSLLLFARDTDNWNLDNVTLTNHDKRTQYFMTCRCWMGIDARIRTLRIATQTCIPGKKGRDCDIDCTPGTFGVNCQKKCHCKDNAVCDTVTGRCPNDVCEWLYGGKDCQTQCNGLKWGWQCDKKCNCRNNEKCGINDGFCENGCRQLYKGRACQTFCMLKFGPTCELNCHCKDDVQCDVNTGKCPNKGCKPPFYGATCQQHCPLNKFLNGTKCTSGCRCLYAEECDAMTGQCNDEKCKKGFQGDDCQMPCQNGTFGSNCALKCQCDENGVCDTKTGWCPPDGKCSMRFYGNDCSKKCDIGRFVINDKCDGICHCKNDSNCRAISGECVGGFGCQPGYKGFKCQTKCGPGEYGDGCSKKCHCLDGSACNHVNGSCDQGCDYRHEGPSCQMYCDVGKYASSVDVFANSSGDDYRTCTETCRCKRADKCRVRDGRCASGGCLPKYKGTSCQEVCDHNTFGANCTKKCHCINDYMCNDINGACPSACHTRWYGPACQQTCPAGKYGRDTCKNYCHCFDKNQCHVLDGQCIKHGCAPGYHGLHCTKCPPGKWGLSCNNKCRCKNEEDCTVKTGFCVPNGCNPRYLLNNCTQTCPLNRYDYNDKCSGKCHCKQPNQCDVLTGDCMEGGCASGYTGLPSCLVDCEDKWGENCEKDCHCLNNEKCNSKTGVCPGGCSYRWFGASCQHTCMRGFYGENCDNECQCLNVDACLVETGICTDRQCRNLANFGYDCQEDCGFGRYMIDQECMGTCHCYNNTFCRVADGRCMAYGCAPGYLGPTCNTTCAPGRFYLKCAKRCHCFHNLSCDIATGECPGFCADGYSGTDCQSLETLDEITPIVGTIVGIVCGCVLVATLIAFVIHQRQHREKRELKETIEEAMGVHEEIGPDGKRHQSKVNTARLLGAIRRHSSEDDGTDRKLIGFRRLGSVLFGKRGSFRDNRGRSFSFNRKDSHRKGFQSPKNMASRRTSDDPNAEAVAANAMNIEGNHGKSIKQQSIQNQRSGRREVDGYRGKDIQGGGRREVEAPIHDQSRGSMLTDTKGTSFSRTSESMGIPTSRSSQHQPYPKLNPTHTIIRRESFKRTTKRHGSRAGHRNESVTTTIRSSSVSGPAGSTAASASFESTTPADVLFKAIVEKDDKRSVKQIIVDSIPKEIMDKPNDKPKDKRDYVIHRRGSSKGMVLIDNPADAGHPITTTVKGLLGSPLIEADESAYSRCPTPKTDDIQI